MRRGRVKMDLAIAILSARIEMDGGACREARVAVGSVAPTPRRLQVVEDMLADFPPGGARYYRTR